MGLLLKAVPDLARKVAVLSILALAPSASAKVAEFTGSGEAVTYRNAQELQRWRFYWSGKRGRLENRRTALLVDLSKKQAYLLNISQKIYAPLPESAVNPLAPFKDFCKEHAAPRKYPGARCERVGHEKIAGRQTEKWVVRGADGSLPLVTANVDVRFGFLIRLRDGATVEELEHLSEKTPAPRLFELPRGFKQVDRAVLTSSFQ